MNKLKNSIETFGLVDPIIINLDNNVIIGGHQRYKALKSLGIKDLNLIELGGIGWCFVEENLKELDDDYEKALNISLNKISGEWDEEKLKLVYKDLNNIDFNLSLTGFDEKEIINKGLLGKNINDFENNNNNYIFEEYKLLDIDVKDGDVFKLDKHIVYTNDDIKNKDFDLCFIFGYENIKYLDIFNDKIKEGSIFYIVDDTDNNVPIYKEIDKLINYHLSEPCLYIEKNSKNDFFNIDSKLFMYGWKNGLNHKWYNDRKQTNVWEINNRNKLYEYLINNSSKKDNNILCIGCDGLDVLLTSEKINRNCTVICKNIEKIIDGISRWCYISNKDYERVD